MLVIQSPEVAIRKPETEPQGITQGATSDEPPVAVANPSAAAIEVLGARIEAMRGTLKWVGGFIVVALLYAAHR